MHTEQLCSQLLNLQIVVWCKSFSEEARKFEFAINPTTVLDMSVCVCVCVTVLEKHLLNIVLIFVTLKGMKTYTSTVTKTSLADLPYAVLKWPYLAFLGFTLGCYIPFLCTLKACQVIKPNVFGKGRKQCRQTACRASLGVYNFLLPNVVSKQVFLASLLASELLKCAVD